MRINHPVDPRLADRMAGLLVHRGPDAAGSYVDPRQTVALAFQRLSIIDLNTGMQPMANEDGTVHLVCNGEIYNFKRLRDDLSSQGHRLVTRGDIEPIVHLYEQYGARFLDYLDGFFALALYDEKNQKLILAVDRAGKKPLYYTVQGGCLYFASECKALKSILTDPQISMPALVDYFRFGYIPAPDTVFQQVRKLPPGHRLEIPINFQRELPDPAVPPPTRYDPLPGSSYGGNYSAARIQLTTLLTAAVAKRMVADVPLGILLSGGLDSSILAALASQQFSGPIKTFSVGFRSELYNELPLAALVAKKYKTDHTELMVEPDLEAMLDLVAGIYGEPFADSSAIPTFLICQMAKKYVTVVLTGDGGDEAFCGYDRYRAVSLGSILAKLKVGKIMGKIWSGPGGELRSRQTRLWRFGQTLAHSPGDQYSMLMRVFSEPQMEGLAGPELKPFLASQSDFVVRNFDSFTGRPFPSVRANFCDFQTYLPGDLLVKIDRASMANSLEARAPFLDQALLEFAKSLPLRYKMGLWKGKRILRDTFGHLLPQELLGAPKRGFGVPMGQWLRSNLANQMQSILTKKSCLVRKHLVNPEYLTELIKAHLSGTVDHGPRLWSLMVLERFLQG